MTRQATPPGKDPRRRPRLGSFSRYVVVPMILVCLGILIGQRLTRHERAPDQPSQGPVPQAPVARPSSPSLEEPPQIEASGQFANNLYPSLVLSLGAAYPDYGRYLTLRLSRLPSSPALQLKVESPLLREPLIVAVPSERSPVELSPALPWDYMALRRTSQDRPETFVVSLMEADRVLTQSSVACVVHSVNEVVSRVVDAQTGGWQDTSVCFAAIVNEDHPEIDALLKEAISRGAISSFTGYQGGERALLAQLEAIWDTLAARGLHYVDLSVTSSVTPGIATQSVRFVEQSLRDEGANCVDASVLMASVLRRIGLRPVLLFKPGHCFVAVYDSAEGGQLIGIETTLIGSGPFKAGLTVGATQVQATLPYLGSADYTLVDIAAARQQGVASIGSAKN